MADRKIDLKRESTSQPQLPVESNGRFNIEESSTPERNVNRRGSELKEKDMLVKGCKTVRFDESV